MCVPVCEYIVMSFSAKPSASIVVAWLIFGPSVPG